MKQFYYTREQNIELPDGSKEVKKYTDSINTSKIIRSVEMEDGHILVLLDDIHQRTQKVPILNKKEEITGYKNQTDTFQTEAHLYGEDCIRFKKLTEII